MPGRGVARRGGILAVTIETLPGYEIRNVFGQVMGATARPQNAFTEGIRELSGNAGPHMPEVLRKYREDAIARMVDAAYRYGANAVVGMRFDHRTIGTGWTEICAYGTAVFIVPVRE
jgi:uncharacterized protein YbjQ (UPF0145 family)